MVESFSTPSAAPVVGFSTQVRTFSDTTLDPQPGTAPKQFVNPANAPVAGFSGQLRAFS